MFLKYDIGVIGIQNVQRALASLERRFRQHNQRVGRMLGTGVGARAGAAARPGAADAAVKKETATRIAGVKAVEAAEAKRIAKVEKMEDRLHAQQTKKRMRAADQVAKAEQRAQQKVMRERDRALKREEQQRLRSIRRQAAAEAKAAKGAALARTQGRQRLVRAIPTAVAGGVGGVLRGVGRYALGGLAIGGGFAAAGAIEHDISIDREMREMVAQAYEPSGVRGSREDIHKTLLAQAKQAGAGGMGTLAAIKGVRKFGEVTGAHMIGGRLSQRFADIAMVSGANIEDVAGVAAEVQQLLIKQGIDPRFGKNAGERQKLGEQAQAEIEKVLMTLLQQGKVGSIEFADFASIGPQIGAAAGKLLKGEGAMSASDAFIQLSAFAQLSRMGGAKGAEEAGTATQRMMDDLVEKVSWEKFGIDRWNREMRGGKERKVGVKAPLQLMYEAAVATGGDLQEMQKLGGIRGRKAMGEVVGMISGLGGGDTVKGMAKFMKLYDPLTKEMGKPEFGASLKYVGEGKGFELARAKEHFMEKLGPSLTALIMKLVPAFEKLLPTIERGVEKLPEMFDRALPHLEKGFKAIGYLLDKMPDDPFRGLGLIIGGLIAKDIISASVGKMVGDAIVRMLAGGAVASTGGAALTRGAPAVLPAGSLRRPSLTGGRVPQPVVPGRPPTPVGGPGLLTGAAAIFGASHLGGDVGEWFGGLFGEGKRGREAGATVGAVAAVPVGIYKAADILGKKIGGEIVDWGTGRDEHDVLSGLNPLSTKGGVKGGMAGGVRRMMGGEGDGGAGIGDAVGGFTSAADKQLQAAQVMMAAARKMPQGGDPSRGGDPTRPE